MDPIMDTDEQYLPQFNAYHEANPQFTTPQQPSQETPQSAPQWVSQFIQILSQFPGSRNATPSQSISQNRPGTSSVSSEADQRQPRHSLFHPDKFTGEDTSQYPQFRSLLEAKLRIDAKAIGSEEERVWYGFGRLSGPAAGRIHPWMQYAMTTSDFNVKGFLGQLDQAFADPQRQAKALNKINLIRQGNRDFRTFLQEFEQTLLEAQGWGWADEVKKGYLRAALNRELCDRLVTQVEPTKYVEFTAQLRMISDKLQQIKAWDDRRNRSRGSYPHAAPLVAPQPGDAMDWEPAHGTIIAATSRTGHPQRHQQRAKWVDYNEIGRRRSEGSCLRCGNQGHMIKSCPLLPAQHPNYQRQQNQLTMRKPQVAATASPRRKITPEIAASDIEESGTDDDSGKGQPLIEIATRGYIRVVI